jgi:hypothetical protein
MPTIQLSPEDRNLLLGIRKDLDSLKRLIKKDTAEERRVAERC